MRTWVNMKSRTRRIKRMKCSKQKTRRRTRRGERDGRGKQKELE